MDVVQAERAEDLKSVTSNLQKLQALQQRASVHSVDVVQAERAEDLKSVTSNLQKLTRCSSARRTSWTSCRQSEPKT